MPDKTILDFPQVTDTFDTDIIYLVRGTGTDRDKYITKLSFLQDLRAQLDPIGQLKMFDAETPATIDGVTVTSGQAGVWVDNVTIPGWYACVAANADKGCPNLVDRFIMGKVVSGAGVKGGSNTLLDHTHTVSTQSASHTHATVMGSHNHVSGVLLDSRSTNLYGAYSAASRSGYYFLASSAGTTESNYTSSTNLGTKTSGNQSASHTHTVGAGSAPTVTNSRPAYYSLIYIRKCS